MRNHFLEVKLLIFLIPPQTFPRSMKLLGKLQFLRVHCFNSVIGKEKGTCDSLYNIRVPARMIALLPSVFRKCLAKRTTTRVSLLASAVTVSRESFLQLYLEMTRSLISRVAITQQPLASQGIFFLLTFPRPCLESASRLSGHLSVIRQKGVRTSSLVS